jgi:hypothetical protein
MFAFLKTHPFAVEAFFERTLVLTFAAPANELLGLLPPCFKLDTWNNTWGFIAVAMVQTKKLRPKGFPVFVGNDFFLTGYRVFVRYKNNAGKNLRGLFILQSETDKKKMEWLGNIFTGYKYKTIDINQSHTENVNTIQSGSAGFSVSYEFPVVSQLKLPEHSPFANWKEARRFAGPLPFTFSFNAKHNEVTIVEGQRENWEPSGVNIINYHFPFFEALKISGLVLANAFVTNHIPYSWKKGRTEPWQP